MNKAFTLTESVIVILIVAILAAVSMPAFMSSYNTLKIETAYKQLLQSVKYSRQLAISRQLRHGLYVIGTGNSYFIYSQTTATTVKDPATQKPLSVFFGVVGQPGTIMITTSGGVPSGVEFDSLGRPYVTGSVVSTTMTITLTYSGITKTVTVEANSGRVQ
jgi:prepilin-type N-terminal cleavage/methylation domain-containing protein